MPAYGAEPFTITAYRYQDGDATKYYEVDDKVDVWAMTTLANTA